MDEKQKETLARLHEKRRPSKDNHLIPIPSTRVAPRFQTFEEYLIDAEEKTKQNIEETDWDRLELGNPIQAITMKIIQPCKYYEECRPHDRTAQEIQSTFDTFRRIVLLINEHIAFTPTVFNFCQFGNFSNRLYSQWTLEDGERGEVCCQIKEFFQDLTLQSTWNGRVKEVSGIFAMKSVYGLRDNDPPQVNIVSAPQNSLSVSEIVENMIKMQQLKEIKES